ncbi:MAG: putative sugar transporter, partial [Solirubrobacterales bacterium]|nr:putative sugar transporter [Solirubrobacterales bacterium]
MRASERANIAAACVASVACGWNLTSVGAVAGPLADHYDASLATIGLLGSGLWLTHALVQAPAGEVLDRVGVRRVAVCAMTLLLVTNLAGLVVGSVALLAVVRALTGVGCGATMVAASLRARPAGAAGQGAIGGAVSAGAALAVATG